MSCWTNERRLKQREAIHNWKPWAKSTGAKSPEGKARSAKNALKTGESKEIRDFIKELNQLLKKTKILL